MEHIFFDLDGTLLSLDVERFMKLYLHGLKSRAEDAGWDGAAIADAVLGGTYAMVKNDGKQTNDRVFWSYFEGKTGICRAEAEPVFEDFYREKFDDASAASARFPETPALIRTLKDKGYPLYLTTNSLFPRIAIEKRAAWAGVSLDDFEFVTTYDVSGACKPNPLFFREVMGRFGLHPEDVLLIGNDAREDGAIRSLGAACMLTAEELIADGQPDCPVVTHAELLSWAESLPDVR